PQDLEQPARVHQEERRRQPRRGTPNAPGSGPGRGPPQPPPSHPEGHAADAAGPSHAPAHRRAAIAPRRREGRAGALHRVTAAARVDLAALGEEAVTAEEIVTARRRRGLYPIHAHGRGRWARVHLFGLLPAEREELPAMARACVEVFAWVHDLAREDDGGGNQ